MKDASFRITLDVNEIQSQVSIPVKIGDTSRKIYISLTEDGVPFVIGEGDYAVLTGTSRSGLNIERTCTIEGGKIVIGFDDNIVSSERLLTCEIRLYNFETDGVLCSASFSIVVYDRVATFPEEEIEGAGYDVDFIDEVIIAEGTRAANEATREDNEFNRGKTFDLWRETISDWDTSLTTLKTETETARDNANTATETISGLIPVANDAAANANTKAGYAKEQAERAEAAAKSIDKSITTYTSADFRNDYRSIGTGWTTSGLAISNTDLLKVKAGDEVSITVPAGFRVDIKVISSEDFAEPGTISLVEDAKSNITESLTHTFVNDGYLDIMVRKPVSGGFASISPSDYACDIKVETKGIVDRMDDAEKRLGEVDNLLEEIGGNVEKNKTSIDTLTKQVLEVIPEKTYTSADFIQGWRQLGIGFENVTTYITNAELLKVEAGDKITINPNGYKLWVSVADTDDYSVSGKTYSLNEPNVTEYFEHTFEKNGYLNINVNNFGHRINPSDYTCDITVVLDDTKHRLTEIENNSKSAEILSPKSRPFTTIVDNCQDASKWTITNKDVLAVDTDCIMGNKSLHCNGRMRCTQTTYDLLNNDLVIKIRINSISYGEEYKGNGIYMRLSNTSTPSIGARYCLMQGAETTPTGDWREITIPYTGYINKDKPELDFSAINDIEIFADQNGTDTNYDGKADWNIQYIGVRPRKLNKGIVSFTFDDGYKSQYTGVKLLAENGISSTIYHIAKATGQSTEILSIEELQELVNYYGADIEVHGDIPENESGENGYNALTDEELIEHWTDSQKFLRENGLSSGRHMSYPGNYHNNRVVQLAKKFFDSCRTIQYYIPCESYPPADHYRLRAVSSVSAALNDVDTIKRYIDRAMESGSWLILTFHRIGDVQGDSMYCSESDLQAIADYAIESGAIIKNIAEVYDTSSVESGVVDRLEVRIKALENQAVIINEISDLVGGDLSIEGGITDSTTPIPGTPPTSTLPDGTGGAE